MEKFVLFMASKSGRIVRAVLGVALAAVGLFLVKGWLIPFCTVLGTVVALGAALDLCLLGLLTKRSVVGAVIRGEAQK